MNVLVQIQITKQAGRRPRTRGSVARAAAEAAAISMRARRHAARAAATSSAPRRSPGSVTRPSASAPVAPPATTALTPTPMGEPPTPPVTSAASGAAEYLPTAGRRRGLRLSHPQTPSAGTERQDRIASDGLKTPSTRVGRDCAVCLSPLRKGNQPPQQQQEVYSIRGCGVRKNSRVVSRESVTGKLDIP